MKSENHNTIKYFIITGIFGIAMGFLEAIVVVYLREIYYPTGFEFPLTLLSPKMISIEWLREITTIIMLAMIGILAGKDKLEKLLFFLYAFAIWDITYYLGLKIILNWPESLLTWDILFLIPVPWLGPVLAPIICSITMIFFAISLIYLKEKGFSVKINIYQWTFIIIGAVLIFLSFIWDYSKIIVENKFLLEFFNLATNEEFIKLSSQYKPTYFNWFIFIIGEILILFTVIYLLITIKSKFVFKPKVKN